MLALLGWNPGTEQEIFSMEELIEAFDLQRVSKSGAKFDPEKTKWFNHQYLVKKSGEELAELFAPQLKERGIEVAKENLAVICDEVKERVNFVHELWEQTDFYFQAPENYDEKAIKKQWKENTAEILQGLVDEVLMQEENYESKHLETQVKAWITAKELGMGKVMAPFRIAVVGGLRGPHLFDITEKLGKAETVNRLQNAISRLG